MHPENSPNAPPSESQMEGKPLYGPGQSYSLSEFDLDPEQYAVFCEGHVLASMHCDGFLNGNLRPEHVFFQPGTGITRTISARMWPVKLSPATMARDFEVPFAAFPAVGFHSILTSYVQSAWLQLEP